ncbi:hypothetical protein I308_106658 [Cryptococcus tetragattii IND107]|uniref:Dol-P-Glc:Glc(2)Man(9)GlcNAc(2)-PP-Dol alpha-1,2-glucosyltransferase n=1 Tax=Cryptococcus tetragattii IND107 TaxID=1296105 RepID=A0ABR3BKY1_9TREE
MSEATAEIAAAFAFPTSSLNPHLDRGMKYVYPKYVSLLFLGTHLLAFSAVNIFHPHLYKEEIPHFNQVLHYARGDFEYHDESMHTSTLWHYAISIPFYLLGITPTLSTLRLTCLFQALLLPTILTIALTPTPSPNPFFPRRFINVFCKPKDYALTIGLNSMVVLMASRFTPGISCLLGLLVLWRSVLKRRYWIGAGVATVIGVMRAGVMVWTAFVLGWVAWGIAMTDRERKHRACTYYPYLFTLVIWWFVWRKQNIPFDWSGIGDFYAFTQLTQPMLPVWAPYSIYLLRHFRWMLLWAFATLCSYTVSDNSRNRVANTVDQCLPLIILRLYLLFLGDKPKESAPAIEGRDGPRTTVAGGELETREQVKGGTSPEEIRQPQTARAAEDGNERGERSQPPNRQRIEAGWYTLISLVAGSLILIIGG